MSTPGLRERKKEATRLALSQAAVRLAMEHGVEHVSAEGIATEAGVSTRTFHNYFSSKEEAVVEALRRETRGIADQLRERPSDEPIWDSLKSLVMDTLGRPESELADVVGAARLVDQSPALRAQRLALVDETDRAVVEVIAERTGTDAHRDLYPRLVHLAASAAMRAVLDVHGSAEESSISPAQLAEQAFAQFAAGLNTPLRES